MILTRSVLFAGAVAVTAFANANLLVADSGGDRIMLFSSFDGSLIDENFITDVGAQGWQLSTPKAALDLGNGEIWVTDQVEDSIFKFDYSGSYLGTITGGMDNIRGLNIVGDEIWVANAGSNNGAPGNAVIRFDFAGNNLGSFATQGSSWDILATRGSVLITDSSADQVLEYDFDGNFVGNFTNNADLNFPQQITNDAESYLVAGFSGAADSGVYQFSPFGEETLRLAGGFGPRGVYRLGNGQILFTKGDGVFSLDPTTDTFVATQLGANAQYIHYTNVVPEPASMLALAAGLGLLASRRRNRK